jgi:multisubunit Na+/H+ antiporter MnhE subunit
MQWHSLVLPMGAVAYNSAAVNNAFAFLLLTPIFLLLLSVLLSWSAFFVGSITGTPLLSFTYGFSSMKRNWRGVIGGILLASAVFAAIAYVKTS